VRAWLIINLGLITRVVHPALALSQGLVINELMPNPKGKDEEFEWIELKNTGDSPIDLSGWYLTKKSSGEEKLMLQIPEEKLISDFFVICSGNSDTQIEAIAESIEEEVKKASGQKPWKREGIQNKEWVLIDYVNVVAHVFNKEKRQFYSLEELWADAKVQHVEEIGN